MSIFSLVIIFVITILAYFIGKTLGSIDRQIENTIYWEKLCDKLINKYIFVEPETAILIYNLYQNVLGVLHRYDAKCYRNCDLSFSKNVIILVRKHKDYYENFIFSMVENNLYIEYSKSNTEDKRPITMEVLDSLFS